MQTEQQVAERVGVSRDDLLRLRRKMKRDVHWAIEPGVGVVFADEGVAELRRLLKLPALEIPKKEEEEAVAVALKTDYPNRQMITATVAGEVVRCRVRNADLYVPGMEFRAVHVQEDLFEETRAPRSRGRI